MPATKEKEEFDTCPFCGWPDIEQNKDGKCICLRCFEQWDEEGTL